MFAAHAYLYNFLYHNHHDSFPSPVQVHTIWHTRSYALGGVEFSPNDFFSPNSQQRWTGLIMNDVNHTALGLPHLTGESFLSPQPNCRSLMTVQGIVAATVHEVCPRNRL